jgi:hypothetical protein
MSKSMSAEPLGPARPRRALRCCAAAMFLAALAGCGGGGGGEPAPAPPPVVAPPSDPGVAGAPFFPLAVGDRWRTRSGNVVETTRVVSQDASGFVLRSEDNTGFVDEQRLVIRPDGIGSVPVPGGDALTEAIGAFDVVRFPLRVGSRYTAVDRAIDGRFDFNGDGRADNLRVVVEVSVVGFERVTVPAGAFDGALRLRSVITQTVQLAGGGAPIVAVSTSDDWYAPGVGPVRNDLVSTVSGASERSEDELIEYRVGPLRSDAVAPAVARRAPADASLGRSALVELAFSEDVERPATGGPALRVFDAAGAEVPGGTVWQDARTLRFVPERFDALVNGRFDARLEGVVEDWSGNRLDSPVAWRFTVDNRGPTLLSQSPPPDATEVPMTTVLSFTFDEPIDPALATPASVTLAGPQGTVAVDVAVDGAVLRITPQTALRGGDTYTVSLNAIFDVLGNGPAFTDITRFTTTRGEPGRFDFPVPLPALAGTEVGSQDLADVDGDGRPDLLAGLRLVRGAAGGGFAATAEALPDSAGCSPAATRLVDIDADGRPDVLGTASFCGTYWLQQRADGTWREGGRIAPFANQAQTIRLAGQARPGILTVGNFDPDLVLVRPAGGAGSTDFQPDERLLASVNGGSQLNVADVDADGREDIVIVQGPREPLVLGLQRADASFDLRLVPVAGAQSVMLVADLDGDGRQDLLLRVSDDRSAPLLLLSQAADGSFALPGRALPLPAPTTDAFRADVDGDGRPELLLTVLDAGGTVVNVAIVVPRGDGSVGYEPLLQYPTPPIWRSCVLGTRCYLFGDFSGDGRFDILHLGQLVTGRGPVVVPAALAARPLGRSGVARPWGPGRR